MTISNVQGNSNNAVSTNGTVLTCTYPSTVTAGNNLIAYYTGGINTTVAFSSVGDTWVTIATFYDSTIGQVIAIGYAENVTSGGPTKTVTATQGTGSVFRGLLIEEWAGLASSGSLDTNTAGRHNAASGTPTDASMTLAGAGELIVGCVIIDGSNTGFTQGSGFTLGQVDNGNFFESEYQILAGSGPIATSWVASPTHDTGTLSAAFKAASGGPPPVNSLYIPEIVAAPAWAVGN